MRFIDDPENPLLEICTSLGFRVIPINKIIFIKSNGKGSDIIISIKSNNETINVRNLLGDFEKIIHADTLFRCHNSFLINFLYVKTYKLHEVTFTNGMTLPISRNKSTLFRENYIRFIKCRKTIY